MFRYYSALYIKYFSYLLVIKRHRCLELLFRIDLFYYLIYLAVNIFCSIFCVSGIADIDICAENLSIINIISLYLAYHLSLISNILKLFLHIYRSIYATTETISVILDLIYSVIKIIKVSKLKLFRTSSQFFEFVIKSIISEKTASWPV